MAKTKKVPAKYQFPEVLYVTPPLYGEDVLDAESTLRSFEDGETVAIYDLVEVHTVRVTRDIIPLE